MNTIDVENTDEAHKPFPTFEEIACLLRGAQVDQQQFDFGEHSDYQFTLDLSEDVTYLVTATIVGITYYSDEPVYSDEVRAEEVDFDQLHSGGATDDEEAIDLSRITTPQNVKGLLKNSNNEDLKLQMDAINGVLQLTIKLPNDPYERQLRTFAAVERVWRNDTQLYPPADVAQPQA